VVRKKIGVIIPVSVYEPSETLVKSATHLCNLDYGDFEPKIVYVFDGEEKDERVLTLKKLGVDVLARNTSRGRRAGAINDGLKIIKKYRPAAIAIFDVDSRPSRDFVIKCAERLERGVYISSSRREVINPFTLIAEGVFIEYKLIGYLLRKSGFRQFNGLIGVLNPEYIFRYRLNENCLTEDADFSTRMHAIGLRAEMCDSVLHEQAPINAGDLVSQRKRWYYGGLELWKYLGEVIRSGNFRFIFSWLLSLTLTYFPAIFFLPVVLTLPPLLVRYGFRGFRIHAGLIFHLVLLQISSISALVAFLRKNKVEWGSIERIE